MKNNMDIKIIEKYRYTGGDEFSHYDAHFKSNPTMEEFVDWLLNHKSHEYGFIIDTKEGFNKIYVEYRDGKIERLCENYNELKNKTIFLTNMDGGWSRMDYDIGFK